MDRDHFFGGKPIVLRDEVEVGAELSAVQDRKLPLIPARAGRLLDSGGRENPLDLRCKPSPLQDQGIEQYQEGSIAGDDFEDSLQAARGERAGQPVDPGIYRRVDGVPELDDEALLTRNEHPHRAHVPPEDLIIARRPAFHSWVLYGRKDPG